MPALRVSWLPLFVLLISCKNEPSGSTGATWELSFALDTNLAKAGDDVGYHLIARSSVGQVRYLENWTLTDEEEEGIAWTKSSLRPTKVGTHHIAVQTTIDQQILVGDATLGVSPGPAVSVDLALDARSGSFEVDERAEAEVSTVDAYGNATHDSWALTVDGGEATIDGTGIYFEEDGNYTVTVTLDNSQLTDSVGPFLVDSSPPVFAMEFPLHEDTTTGDHAKITGSVTDDWAGLLYATIDGSPIEMNKFGRFSILHSWDFGLNVITLAATDNDGNSTSEVHSVLRGEFLPESVPVPEGLVVHIADGEGGLDEVIAGADAAVAGIDISSALPIDITGTKYDISITDITYDIGGLDIVPKKDELVTTVTLENIVVDIEGEVKAGAWIDASGNVSIDSVDVAVSLDPNVSSTGRLTVSVLDTDVNINNLQMNFESTLFRVMDTLGVDVLLEEYITTLLEDQIAYQISYQIQSQVEGVLSALVLEQTVSVMGEPFTISGEFSRIDVATGGVTVALDVDIHTASELPETTMPGSLYAPYAAPDMGALGGVAAGISLDMINRLLHIAWAGGALNQTISAASIGLPIESLQLVFPEATDVTFVTECMLPPIVVPGSMLIPMEAQFGSVKLTALDQNGMPLVEMYIGLILDVDVDVESDGLTLVPSLEMSGDPWVEVVETSATSTGIINYASLVDLFLPQILDSIAYSLQAVTLPTFGTTTISVSRITPYGADGGYLTAVGTIDLGD